jgi:hypothetical protein
MGTSKKEAMVGAGQGDCHRFEELVNKPVPFLKTWL